MGKSLRKVFTQTICRKIQASDSINVFGDEGSGKSRLLSDVVEMCDATATVIVIDLRHHRHDYHGFCQELQTKLGIAQDKSLSAVNLYLL